MAIIGRLRNKMGALLVGLIGFALFAFILGELLTSRNSFLFGGGSSADDNSLAVIGGERVDGKEFETRATQAEENYMQQTQQQQLDQNAKDMVREQIFNEILRERIYNKQLEKVGLSVTEEELADMCFGNNIDPQIRQAFTDPKTGQFDKSNVINYIKNMDNLPNDPDKKGKKQWMNFEDQLEKNRKYAKYEELVKAGIYVTTEETKADFYDKGRSVDARVVKVLYNSVADSTVAVSDAELKEYYNSNQYKYKATEAARSLRFVMFDIMPSAEDRKAVIDDMARLFTAFQTATNDSLFAVTNTDDTYNDTYRAKGEFSPSLDSVVFNTAIGTVLGPYEEAGGFKIAKVLGRKSMYDSVEVRHILVAIQNPADSTAKKAKADSIINVIKGGTDFGMLADQITDDQGSKGKGGSYGWQTPAVNFVPEFKEAMFNGKLRELQLVRTQFGYHIIQITDQKNMSTRVRVAEVVRSVQPSNRTTEMVYNRANTFASANQSLEAFEAAAKKENLFIRPADNLKVNDKNVGGLGPDGRVLVTWAFGKDVKRGMVSRPEKVGARYVVAAVSSIAEKGITPFDDVKAQVEMEVRKQKKAAQFMEKMKGSANIEGLAQKLNATIDTVRGINFGSPYIAGIGPEPAVNGTAPSLKINTLSAPIKGNNGVYIIAPYQVNEPTATPTDYKPNKTQLMQMLQSQSSGAVFNALKEKANIVDNRHRFF